MLFLNEFQDADVGWLIDADICVNGVFNTTFSANPLAYLIAVIVWSNCEPVAWDGKSK